jgi:hypothetical protein
MKNIVQGKSAFLCECRRHNFECDYCFVKDSDWEIANNARREYSAPRMWIVRNEHVPLKGCVVVKKFERSSIIYYT